MSAHDRVRLLDLTRLHAPIRSELDAALAGVVDSGTYVLGPQLRAFEEEWARHCSARHAVGVGSGLSALTIALHALGVGPGDEVVVPTNTFIATWLAVSAVGARVVPVEPDEDTHLVDVAAAAAAIGPRTAALLPVHLYGQPVDVEGFEALALQHGLALVFDAAQAHGATAGGRPVGGRGTVTAWSFYPGKNLGALGDGGAVTTDDPGLATRVARLRDYGRSAHSRFAERGWNSRLDEVQAAVLRVKLRHLGAWNARRAQIADGYLGALASAGLGLPVVRPGCTTAWHQFVVRTPERDALAEHLAADGIETAVHYPVPPHRQAAYAADDLGRYPVAERLAAEVLSLPVGPHLDAAESDRVARAVARSVANGDGALDGAS